MAQRQRIHFNSNSIRVIDRDGSPWFVLVDVCEVLDIANVGNALARLDPAERNTIRLTDSNQRGNPNRSIISESGLYKLVLRSDKPEAKPFQDWVTKVVLPAIRKDGAYVAGEEEMSEDEFIRRAVTIMQRKVERPIFCGGSLNSAQDDVPKRLGPWGQLDKKKPFLISALDQEPDNHPHMREP